MIATLEIFINERGPYVGTLKVETEEIDVTMGRDTYKLDPKWTFVDKAGHFHAVAGDGKLPTLERYEKHIGCDGTCGGTCDGTPGSTAVPARSPRRTTRRRSCGRRS